MVRSPRYAEVDDARPVLGHQDVARFEVPVHQARPLDVAQRLGEPQSQRTQFPLAQRAVLLHDFGEVEPRHVERRHPRLVGVRVGVHDRRGEGAAHSARRLDLLPEARPELFLLGVRPVHELDRDLPSRGGDSQIDDSHAARPEAGREGCTRLWTPGPRCSGASSPIILPSACLPHGVQSRACRPGNGAAPSTYFRARSLAGHGDRSFVRDVDTHAAGPLWPQRGRFAPSTPGPPNWAQSWCT